MKTLFRKILSPILTPLESSDGDYIYRPSYRKILIAMAVLFLLLASGSLVMSLQSGILGGLIPAVFFGGTGVICLAVAWLGNDRAVARIWRNR